MFACLQDLASAAGVFSLSRHLLISVSHDIRRSSSSFAPVSLLPTPPDVWDDTIDDDIQAFFFENKSVEMNAELQLSGFGLRKKKRPSF